MTSKKTTQRALLSSLLSLLLCCSMLLGTTFAWFTDEVTSANNIIKSGTLDVEMYWANTLADIQSETDRENAAEGAIFDYKFWEPGYVDVKYIQLVNAGDLAFKYQLLLQPENAISDGMMLAEVIDVYCAIVDDASDKDFGFTAPSRTDFGSLTKLGTLKDLMLQPEGMDTGVLLPKEGNTKHVDKETITDEYYEESVTVCLALKMQEEAGNEYQNLSIGDGFAVKLLATQYTYEEDSFNHLYDEWANGDSLVADVTPLGTMNIMATWGMGGQAYPMELTPAFQFEPTETYEEAQESPYRYYHADFVVSADKDVAAEALALAGYYAAFCEDFNNNNWVALKSDMAIPAGEEIRLVHAMGNGSITVNYEELCRYGNDGIGFRCGASALDPSVIGTTLTVKLRLYETTGDPSTPDGPKNIETGEFMTIATYKHTFGIDAASNLQSALANGGTVVLTGDLDLGDTQITIPAGVEATLDLNGYDLTGAHNGADHYAMFTIQNGAKLTVKGEGEVAAVTNFAENNRSGALFQNAGELILESGSYTLEDHTTDKTWIIATIVDNRTNSTSCETKLTINGGEYSVTGNAKNLFRNYPQQGGTAALIINDGTFNANADKETYIWNQESRDYVGTLTFNGGTYVGNVVFEDYNGQSDITVSDAAIAGGLKAYSGNT